MRVPTIFETPMWPQSAEGTRDGGNASPTTRSPGLFNYVLGFLLVGMAWGLTTPFIRRAAKNHNPAPRPMLDSDALRRRPLVRRALAAVLAVVDLLRNPAYAVPLMLNLTGSVWFFLLIGQAGIVLTFFHFCFTLGRQPLLIISPIEHNFVARHRSRPALWFFIRASNIY